MLAAGSTAAAGSGETPRVLMIAVDGVPYSRVASLTDPSRGEDALFRDLEGPGALINTFPSSSYVAFSALLEPFEVAEPLGYEVRYYDAARNDVTGGLTPIEVPAPWKDFFDWKLDSLTYKAVAYGWPRVFSVREVASGFEAFAESDAPFFAMYVVSTDGIGHLHGPHALDGFLEELDARLTALRERTEEPFRVVLFSDHGTAGGEPLTNTWPAVESALERAGFDLTGSRQSADDVVVIPYGLVTSFVAYPRPDAVAEVASVTANVAGVDLCVHRRPGGWRVVGGGGDALIERRSTAQGTSWRYRPRSGDPLGYAPITRLLARRTGEPGRRWFSDEKWFEATARAFYPDALYRLTDSLELTRNPAPVVCSVAPGHVFGARTTDYLARATIGQLRWTHGALHRPATTGFLMTDLPGWSQPDAVRYTRALAFVERHVAEHRPQTHRRLTARASEPPE